MSGALVVRVGALGDILLLRPLVAGLRERHGRVTLLAPRHSGRVLLGHEAGDVDECLDWDTRTYAPLVQRDPLPSDLAGWVAGFDAAVLVSRDPTLAGHARAHVGVVAVADPQPPDGVHAAAHYAASAGIALGTLPPYAGDADERAAARALLEAHGLEPGFVALHPGSGSRAKNWPAERFAPLAGVVSAHRPFVVIEGPADADACAVLRRLSTSRVVRDAAPRALGALLAGAGLYVGNDSGVSHLAAAWGAPTLALFGPTDPRLWCPLGSRTASLRAADGRLDTLSTDEVASAARGLARP